MPMFDCPDRSQGIIHQELYATMTGLRMYDPNMLQREANSLVSLCAAQQQQQQPLSLHLHHCGDSNEYSSFLFVQFPL
jgi:hypothetical protein